MTSSTSIFSFFDFDAHEVRKLQSFSGNSESIFYLDHLTNIFFSSFLVEHFLRPIRPWRPFCLTLEKNMSVIFLSSLKF